jgi:hypothetical protein
MLSTVGASPSASGCTAAVLDQKVSETPVPVTERSAVNLVEASSQYQSAVRGYNSTFTGAGTEWNEDSTTCTVSWSNFDVHSLLIATNGSAYVLTIAANPSSGTISTVTITPVVAASIASESSTTYSGYEVATSSAHDTTVDYSTAYWFVPTVSGTSSECGSNGTCELFTWTGVQNSTYLGANHVGGSGEVIQGGTYGEVPCYEGSCLSPADYGAWGEYLYGNSNGVQRVDYSACSMTVKAGDTMYEEVGSGYAINGSSSSTYHSIINDFTQGHICQPFGGGLTYYTQCFIVKTDTDGNCEMSGTEYFAGYILETPQTTGGSTYPLPKFTVPGEDVFDILGMYSTSQGAWTYYNDGYYQYAWMENSNTNNTSVTPMYENSGGSTYGYFNETWLSSSGT